MNPSPAAISLIRAHVTDWTPNDASILASLNAATIDNPTPQPNIASTCYPSEILSLLSTESMGKIDHSGFASKLYDDLQASNNEGVGRWAMYYEGIASITTEEAGAIIAHAQSATPDPSWPSLVSWAVLNIGRQLDLADIAASRPGA